MQRRLPVFPADVNARTTRQQVSDDCRVATLGSLAERRQPQAKRARVEVLLVAALWMYITERLEEDVGDSFRNV